MAIVLMVGFQRGYSEKLRLLGGVVVSVESCALFPNFSGPTK